MKLSLLVVVLNFLCLQVLTSTIEDAEKALQGLDDLILSYQDKLRLHMNDQSNILRGQLTEMQSQTQQEIIDIFDNISTKISTLIQNTENSTGANVYICLGTTTADFQEFAAEMNERLVECYGNMIMTGNFMLHSTWNKVWEEYDVDYQCTKMTFEQCKNYEDITCVDAVLDNIEFSKNSTEQVFKLLTADMVNQITGMDFPCRQMIVEELALYPSLMLNFVGTCLKTVSVEAYKLSC